MPFAELCGNWILDGPRIAGAAAPHQQMRHTPRPLKSLRSLRTGYETCFVAFERSKMLHQSHRVVGSISGCNWLLRRRTNLQRELIDVSAFVPRGRIMIAEPRPLPDNVGEPKSERIPGGSLITVADPWIFIRRRTYHVSETHGPAIAARLHRARIARMFFVAPLSLLLLIWISNSPLLKQSNLAQTAILIAALTFVFLTLLNAVEYLAVKSLLRGTPPVSHRISLAEILLGRYEAMSVKALVGWAVLSALAATLAIFHILTSAHVSPLDLTSAISIGLLALLKVGALIARFARTR